MGVCMCARAPACEKRKSCVYMFFLRHLKVVCVPTSLLVDVRIYVRAYVRKVQECLLMLDMQSNRDKSYVHHVLLL